MLKKLLNSRFMFTSREVALCVGFLLGNFLFATAEDWNNPTLTSNYVNVLSDLKDRDVSVATMDFSSSTNVPTGVIRWNGTSQRFETWNGSTWDDLNPALTTHLASTSNPHLVTAAQVGAASTTDLT
jgi:hypothetical protein